MKRPASRRAAEARSRCEREHGLDPEDEAARWLREHDPEGPPEAPRSVAKSKLLHQWRRRQTS